MQIRNNDNKLAAIFLTLLFPFGGLIYTLSNWRESWAKNTFWLVCVYMGAVLIYWPEGAILGMGADGGRYVLQLMAMYNGNESIKAILGRYLMDEYTMDLYFPIVAFLVSRFTDNGHILFTVFAFVFGYFYSRNIWYILEKLPGKKLGFLVIFVILFFLTNPITNISGVRYNTAIHIYVYAMLPYLLDNDKSKLWWLIVAPLVHFSFLYVSVIAVAYVLLIPNKLKTRGRVFQTICLIIFIISFFINSLNLSSVNAVLEEYSPESYERKIDTYVNQDVADIRSDAMAAANWYVGASGIIKNWSYSLLLVLLLPCIRRNYKGDSPINNIYTFTLLFFAFANIMALVPSGGRFLMVAHMFSVAIILLVSMSIPKKDNYFLFLNFSLLFLLIPVVFEIRKLFDYFGITALIGNFITALFWENNVPLIDLIKRII